MGTLIKLGLLSVLIFFSGWWSVQAPIEQKVEPEVVLQEIAPIVQPYVERKGSVGDCAAYAELISSYDWPVVIALEICQGESGGDPFAIGDTHLTNISCGLMQINMLEGRPTCKDMLEADKNVAFAYKLWREEGFCPWSVYKGEECNK